MTEYKLTMEALHIYYSGNMGAPEPKVATGSFAVCSCLLCIIFLPVMISLSP